MTKFSTATRTNSEPLKDVFVFEILTIHILFKAIESLYIFLLAVSSVATK